jgi:O-antigen/teichoic acid export membrane protein
LSKKNIFSSIFSIFSTNIFIMVMVAAAGIILPRLLTVQALGRLNSLTALATIVYSFAFLGMRSSLVMHLGKQKFEEEQILRATAYIFILSSILSTLAILFFFFFLSTDEFPLFIVLLVCLINPFEFLISYMQGHNLALGRYGNFNRLKWVPRLIYLLAILLFVGVLGWNIRGALLSIILSNLMAMAIYLGSRGRTRQAIVRGPMPVQVIRSLLAYGMLYALALLLTRLNHKIDILILKRMSDIAEVGFYSLGANVAETLWQVPIAVGVVLMSRSASQRDERVSTGEVCSSLRISLLLVAAGAIILYLAAPLLVTLLFGERYAASVPILRTILPGILFFVILKILNSQFVGTGKPQLTLIALLPSLLVNIVLNILFIPSYGGTGAALATNISYFSASLLLLLVYSRTFHTGLLEIFRYRRSDFAFVRKINFRR